jgi:hypothetical protein
MPADGLDDLIKRVLCLQGSILHERERFSDRAVGLDRDAALSLRQPRHTFERWHCFDVHTLVLIDHAAVEQPVVGVDDEKRTLTFVFPLDAGHGLLIGVHVDRLAAVLALDHLDTDHRPE